MKEETAVRVRKAYNSEIAEQVIAGLSKRHKQLPCKLFYDEKGSQLFDKICSLDEYYPTRTEIKIMRDNIKEIAECMGNNISLFELGSGSSIKTRLLLDNLKGLTAYIPMDISSEHLMKTAELLRADYPGINIVPLPADYTGEFYLPSDVKKSERIISYFPGSTVGNFTPAEAKTFLSRIAGVCGNKGGMLIGVDLKKHISVLEAAYDDSKGITAEFNLNILSRINRELGANFNVSMFRHNAFYNSDEGRIEMHLVSEEDQIVRINGTHFEFIKGEDILTEYSYKYTLKEFEELLSEDFKVKKIWTDESGLFSVQYFEVK